MATPLERAYFDLAAYGEHMESCTRGRILVAERRASGPGKRGGRAAIREKGCSCGLELAFQQIEVALYGRVSPGAARLAATPPTPKEPG
jgi:hypothetical protein